LKHTTKFHFERMRIRDEGRAVKLQPMRFQCTGVCISTGLPCIYHYSWPYVYKEYWQVWITFFQY